jgi:hypothetical protein
MKLLPGWSHTEHVGLERQALQDSGLGINSEKCVWGVSDLNYLVHKILATGVLPLPSHVTAIQEIPAQHCTNAATAHRRAAQGQEGVRAAGVAGGQGFSLQHHPQRGPPWHMCHQKYGVCTFCLEGCGQRRGSQVLRLPAVLAGKGPQAASSSTPCHSGTCTQILPCAHHMEGHVYLLTATDRPTRWMEAATVQHGGQHVHKCSHCQLGGMFWRASLCHNRQGHPIHPCSMDLCLHEAWHLSHAHQCLPPSEQRDGGAWAQADQRCLACMWWRSHLHWVLLKSLLSHQQSWQQDSLSSSQASCCKCQTLHVSTCLHHPHGQNPTEKLLTPHQLTWQSTCKCVLATNKSLWRPYMPACTRWWPQGQRPSTSRWARGRRSSL